MGQTTLVTEEINAGAELVRRMDDYAPVKAAFWLKGFESGRWYLYITSDQIDETNLNAAYGEVMRLSWQIDDPFLDPFHVKLIPSSHPLARAASEIHRQFPGIRAERLGGQMFGGQMVEDVYLYPASVATPTP